MNISIQPANFVTGTATNATYAWISYAPNGSAQADIHLYDDTGKEVGSRVVDASAEEAATWGDDLDFLAVLAAKVPGVTPLDPPTEWIPE